MEPLPATSPAQSRRCGHQADERFHATRRTSGWKQPSERRDVPSSPPIDERRVCAQGGCISRSWGRQNESPVRTSRLSQQRFCQCGSSHRPRRSGTHGRVRERVRLGHLGQPLPSLCRSLGRVRLPLIRLFPLNHTKRPSVVAFALSDPTLFSFPTPVCLFLFGSNEVLARRCPLRGRLGICS